MTLKIETSGGRREEGFTQTAKSPTSCTDA
jgi:hypothetical protein